MILAYSHCIAHGIALDAGVGARQQKLAVDCGQWLLYRFDPRRAERGENPLQLDSPTPRSSVADYMMSENRFKMLTLSTPMVCAASPLSRQLDNIKRMEDAGAAGLVLFNRFYQPDINLETLEVHPNILHSTPMDIRLPLRWIAILYGHVTASLAATSGIHRGGDVLKLLMAGADVAMLCSVIMRHGLQEIGMIECVLAAWMAKHEYESVRQMRGSLSQMNCANPAAFERAQYMRAITGNPASVSGPA